MKFLLWLADLFFRPRKVSEEKLPTFKVIPAHIAIIMDGNGRWAQKRGLPRAIGHRAGIESLREVVRISGEIGVKAVSVYTFSTENWQRPRPEVDFLMNLLEETIKKEVAGLDANEVRIRFLGRLEELSPKIQAKIREAEAATADNTGLTLNLLFNYGGRAEIVDAVKKIGRQITDGQLAPEAVTEALISKNVYTAGQPDPDLMIRTGGDERVSNFLLWQSAYAELYFTPTYWPDFRREEFLKALAAYESRQRKFGKTQEQIEQEKASG